MTFGLQTHVHEDGRSCSRSTDRGGWWHLPEDRTVSQPCTRAHPGATVEPPKSDLPLGRRNDNGIARFTHEDGRECQLAPSTQGQLWIYVIPLKSTYPDVIVCERDHSWPERLRIEIELDLTSEMDQDDLATALSELVDELYDNGRGGHVRTRSTSIGQWQVDVRGPSSWWEL